MEPSMSLPPVVHDVLGHGVTVIVATTDAQLRPHIARAWGPELTADRHIGVCVEAPADSKTNQQLTNGAEIAVTLTRPSTYLSIQLKGVVLAVGAPTAFQLRRVDEHHAAFAAEAASVGVSTRLTPRLIDRGSLIWARVAVHDCFDQTPGVTAGARL
jgi:hypothetical protein